MLMTPRTVKTEPLWGGQWQGHVDAVPFDRVSDQDYADGRLVQDRSNPIHRLQSMPVKHRIDRKDGKRGCRYWRRIEELTAVIATEMDLRDQEGMQKAMSEPPKQSARTAGTMAVGIRPPRSSHTRSELTRLL